MQKVKNASDAERIFNHRNSKTGMKIVNVALLKKILQSAILMVLVSGFAFLSHAEEIKGTGTILPAILIKSWGDAYAIRHPSVVVKYKSINTNEGIKSLLDDEIDFALLDMPLSKEELTKKDLIQFPIALAAVTPIVNIPGVYTGQLNLSGKLIGDIFLGNIARWNDPDIVAMNPKLHLPDQPIIVVHRSAPAGVKTIIGDYIAKNNEQWKTLKGSTMTDYWPATAIEVKTPNETFEVMKRHPYSIGYASLPFSIKSNLPYAHLKNPAGFFVGPDHKNVTSASINAKWDIKSEFNEILSDQPGANSWPMTNTSFVLIRKTSSHPEQTKQMLNFFRNSLRNGALNAVAADYVPLPAAVIKQVMESWKSVVDTNGNRIFN